MHASVKLFAFDDTGQGLLEYALIILLVALVAIGGLRFFGSTVNNSLVAPAVNLYP